VPTRPIIQCYYTLSSPWAYFAGPRLGDIIRRHGAELILKPYDFQAVVPKTGGIPIRTRPLPRQEYHAVELRRWSEYLGMPLNPKPQHYPPSDNKTPGHTVIAAQAAGYDAPRLSHAILRAIWAEERNVALAATRKEIADENEMDGDELIELEISDAVVFEYQRNTDEVEQLGIFGAPTYLLNGELFWGQDRLEFLDRALAQACYAGPHSFNG
jgi:2-hydroxychromene-2-carboxylate isomerase